MPVLGLLCAVVIFASQAKPISADVLRVHCNQRRCQGEFADYELKYVDEQVQATLRDGKLIVTYSGVYQVYDDWVVERRQFTSAIDQHGRQRKLSSVKSICVIGDYSGDGGCAAVRR